MSDTKTLQSIADDAKDIFKTQIEWGNVDPCLVPNDDDKTLSFETNQVKRGKKFTTAVLFVDLRNSTTLNFEHNPEQLGKLYAAFVRSMIQCAEQYRGVIRNIIGDRVMVVFPEKNCCTNAVNTAITATNVRPANVRKKARMLRMLVTVLYRQCGAETHEMQGVRRPRLYTYS